ncbi:flagellar basal body rod protein [Petrotoga mobilis SJ95]|uniref:Flagellar basal body rod protein n=1 Tax=Petrotoga mobilis (strain DSM 10674 / SJ95) TaxID=403833 RepID=A9BF12_PETMO|nr:flagellar hook-basal body protein [Petrotoga mobilis]ABX31076.1 flagellar basal body rod protein [Petrotoga mobilis SJ95]
MKGIYNATAGMLNSFAELNSISNNLANLNTVGYKKDFNLFKSVYEKEIRSYQNAQGKGEPIGNIYSSVVLDEVIPNLEQGPLVETSGKLDFAIEGDGFFKIERNGNYFYTRNGEFSLSPENYLVTKSGDYVLDEENNPILVDLDNFFVDEEGNISGTNTRLNILNVENLNKYGENYFTGEELGQAGNFNMRQGFLESSNVDALNEMIKMIEANRKFDILQKAVLTGDSLNAKLIEITSNF